MKKAFTLLEVNLAMFVMAIGVLSMIALYPLGFREAEQSREDVAAAAYCESVLNSMAAALSATNIHWSAWANLDGKTFPSEGWREYFNDNYFGTPRSLSQMKSTANSTFQEVVGQLGQNTYSIGAPPSPEKLGCGLVVSFTGTRCAVAVRATRRPGMLLAQPLFFTEVNFQGDMTK